jgi:hypothetical protein
MFRAGARAEWNTANRGSGVAEHKEAVLCSGLQDIAVPLRSELQGVATPTPVSCPALCFNAGRIRNDPSVALPVSTSENQVSSNSACEDGDCHLGT